MARFLGPVTTEIGRASLSSLSLGEESRASLKHYLVFSFASLAAKKHLSLSPSTYEAFWQLHRHQDVDKSFVTLQRRRAEDIVELDEQLIAVNDEFSKRLVDGRGAFVV